LKTSINFSSEINITTTENYGSTIDSNSSTSVSVGSTSENNTSEGIIATFLR
jgi:hypothetical protein